MEDELFDYGTFKLRKDALIYNINNEKNLLRAIEAHRFSEQDERDFRTAVAYLAEGIANGTITKDLQYKPEIGKEGQIQLLDSKKGIKGNKMHSKAISYFQKIAEKQGNLKENAKATQVKEKKYDTIDMYLAKSLYPKATGLTDLNIDWNSFTEKYKNQSHKAAYDIISGFVKSENIDPEMKSKLETLLPKMNDADGISVDDRLEMNRAGIPGTFIPFLDKMLTKTIPPGGSNKKDNDENSKDDDRLVVTSPVTPTVTPPQDTTPKLGEQVVNASQATENGHWYIEGKDKNRKKWVLWNNKFHEVPLSFINDEYLENLRKELQEKLRNRYNDEKVDELLKVIVEEINKHGMQSDNAYNNYNSESIRKLLSLLYTTGIADRSRLIDGINIIKKLSILPDKVKHVKANYMGRLPFARYNTGGNIIKAWDGTKLLYDPNNELYKSLYKVGAQSQGLINADNSLRSKNLKFNTVYDKELDLNSYYKGFNLYNNPDDRHKDFITWANKYYKEGDTLNSLLNRYNEGIDNIYKYKQSDNARTYKDVNGNVFKSQETGIFNTSYNDYYNSANANIFGYDPNSIKIAGSATMARHPDITDNDIQMDFSKHEVTNETLKKLLNSAKIVKYKTGHYGYVTDQSVTPEEKQEDDKLQGGDSDKLQGDDNNAKLPEKEEQVNIPETPSKLAMNAPFIAAGLADAYATNAKIHNLQGDMIFAQRPLINLHRPVYGNLRALAEANRRAGQRNAMARQLFTADSSRNTALMLDAFNQNTEDWLNALKIDDDTYRETSEKARQEKKEEYLTNQEIAWGNRQAAVQHHNEGVVSDMTKVNANYQSRKNALDEFKTYLMADITKRNEDKLTLAHTRLWNHMQQSPISYIGGWTLRDQELWNRYLAGESITDPTEKQKLMQIQNIMNDIYLQKRFPNAGFKMPHMNNINLPEPDPEVVATLPGKRKGGLLQYVNKHKGGGKVTNDQVKAIISYLKESNKNYNKAIDRSVKGLYNSIKLQKQRKK